MSNAIEFINVSKKFKKGEKFDSLRDFIPNLFKNILSLSHLWERVGVREEGRVRGNGELLRDQEFLALKDVSFHLSVYSMKSFFFSAKRGFKGIGHEFRCIKNLQKDRFILLRKMDDYLSGLFRMVNFVLRKFKHHNVAFSIITNIHNVSFLLGKR